MSAVSYEVERDAIHKAVGGALDAWSRVEAALEAFFAALLRGDLATADIIMASIINFNARVEVCDNLMINSGLPPKFRARWANIGNRLSKQYKRRHEIAHFTIVGLPHGKRGDRPVLIPFYSTGALALKYHESGGDIWKYFREAGLNPTKIDARAERFATLADDLNLLARDLEKHVRQHAASRALASNS